MKKYLMGIDSGTQSTRAIIFDTEGTMISEASETCAFDLWRRWRNLYG